MDIDSDPREIIQRDARETFNHQLKMFGEDFDIAGETKRGLFIEDRNLISFPPDEFPVKRDDVVRRWAAERKYSVVYAKLFVEAGAPISFDVVVSELD